MFRAILGLVIVIVYYTQNPILIVKAPILSCLGFVCSHAVLLRSPLHEAAGAGHTKAPEIVRVSADLGPNREESYIDIPFYLFLSLSLSMCVSACVYIYTYNIHLYYRVVFQYTSKTNIPHQLVKALS